MIDFNYTNQTQDGQVEFVNHRGETVRSYPIEEIERYVADHKLAELKADFYEIGEVFDPVRIPYQKPYFGKFDKYLVDRQLDYNFEHVAKDFYNFKNPHEFKSANREQETRKAVKG